jgi:hypothetical protein
VSDPQFVYLDYGNSSDIRRELFYSIRTLMAEIGDCRSRVTIFTDRPERFSGLGSPIVDITPFFAEMTNGGTYRHRAKPAVLARALRMHERPCVLVDSDSFVREGFDAAVQGALADGAAMNFLVRTDPYPGLRLFETQLPLLGSYRYEAQRSLMFNSGLVAARPEHAALLDEAIVLIDRIRATGLRDHDVEQFAITECFRIARVPIATIDRNFEHYCQHWSKRYMRRRFRPEPVASFTQMQPARPIYPLTKTRVRIFKRLSLLKITARTWSRRLLGLIVRR